MHGPKNISIIYYKNYKQKYFSYLVIAIVGNKIDLPDEEITF